MAMIAPTMQDEKRIEVIQRKGDRFPDRCSHCSLAPVTKKPGWITPVRANAEPSKE
jgi:hypothetical protein